MSNRTLAQLLRTSLDSGRFAFPERLIDTAYTMTGADNGTRLVGTTALTITVPAVGILGNGFECEVINDSGGSVILAGPGVTDVTLTDGQVAAVIEANGKQRVAVGDTTVIS